MVHDGAYASATGFVVDSRGERHVISASERDRQPFRYFTQGRQQSQWVDHRLSPRVSKAGITANDYGAALASQLVTSTNHNATIAVATDCKGLYVGSTTAGEPLDLHLAFPEPPAVCRYDVDTSDGTVIAGEAPRFHLLGAVAMPHGRLAILLWRFHDHNEHLYVGRAGHRFRAVGQVPSGVTTVVPSGSFSRDPVTGSLVAVVNIVTDTAGGPTRRVLSAVVVVTKRPGKPWSKPVTVASGSETSTGRSPFIASSVAASKGRIFIAGGSQEEVNGTETDDEAALLERSKTGSWVGPQPFPHTSQPADANLILQTNPDTAHVHAAWSHIHPGMDLSHNGIMRSALVSGRWTAPAYAVRGCDCRPVNLAFNRAEDVLVGYTGS